MAKDLKNHLSKIHTIKKVQLKKAQEQQKSNMDAYCKEQPHFYISNKIWLLCHNIKIIHSYDKLDYHRFRPFPICEKFNIVTYWLHLVDFIKIHLIFYMYLLEVYKTMNIFKKKKKNTTPSYRSR